VEQIDDAVLLSSYDPLNRLLAQAPGGPLVVAGTLNEPATARCAYVTRHPGSLTCRRMVI
jgi:hypothetical protein